jgi:hypothetical protein
MTRGKCQFVGVAASLLLWLSGTAEADDLKTVPSLGNTVLDLDTGNGNYSQWKIDDLGTVNSLRTTLQVHRLGDDPRWAPSVTIVVGNKDENVSFQVLSATRQPPLTMHMGHYVAGKLAEDRSFTKTVDLNEKLDVAVDWTAAGVVTVTLGDGETQTFSLKAAPTSLSIDGSTGEAEFNPLRIGHAGQ